MEPQKFVMPIFWTKKNSLLDEKLCIRSLEESVEIWNDYRSLDMSDITILKMDCTNYRLCTKLARSVIY